VGKAGKAGAVRDCLLKAGIRPSYPRIRVLDYLVTMKTHPTAEEVFSHLVKEMPTLSRTTVYNTLNLLVGAGLARTLTIEGMRSGMMERHLATDISSAGTAAKSTTSLWTWAALTRRI